MTCFTGPLAMGCETFARERLQLAPRKARAVPASPLPSVCRAVVWGAAAGEGVEASAPNFGADALTQAGAELAKSGKVRRRIAAVYLRARHFQGGSTFGAGA